MTCRRRMLLLLVLLCACGGGDSTGNPADDGVPEVPADLSDTSDALDIPEARESTDVADVPLEDIPELPADATVDTRGDAFDAPDAPDAPTDLVVPPDVPTDLVVPPDALADVLDVPDAAPDAVRWAGSDPFPLDGAFYRDHPAAFERMSRYATHVKGPVGQRPNVGHRGAFGAGEGHVFGFVGLADPLNTLHSLVGPTYERRPNFFGDWSVRIARPQDSIPPDFEEEWAGRSLSAPVVVTRGRLGDIELDTIDNEAQGCWSRILVVRNRGVASSGPVDLVVSPTNSVTSPAPGLLVESQRAAGGRVRDLAVSFVGAGAVATDGRLVLGLGEVAPGAEVVRLLSLCPSERAEDGPVPVVGGPVLGTQDLPTYLAVLDAAAARYRQWEGGLLRIDVPDPMVLDFLDGMKMTLKVQTAATGATCPMSQYTRTWARDNIGPVMALLAFGAFDDVEAMLDYVYAAIRYGGDLKNSYDADLVVADAPPAPDWAAMEPLSGRVAAETPSYMVRMYGLHHRYTGDPARATERWGLLRRCLFAQAFGPDRLLPFTGDETYRAAMNGAAGLDLEYPHHEKTWSANSTFLWLGAAREMARLAEALGRPTEREEARALADEVETVSVPRFGLDDGCVAAFAYRDTLQMSLPFEDVALQVTWSGWKDGDDPFAQTSLDCLVKRLGRAPGEIVSRFDPIYEGLFDAWEGVYTGMLPGYALAAMTDTVHPQAADAFAAVRKSLDTSGNLQEYMIFDDHSGLSVAYDPVGGLGDYTTKFRPWEGGIVAEAVLRYLVGFQPDATLRTVSLRPHLPAGWPRMAFSGLRAGPGRFDLTVERSGAGEARVTIAPSEGAPDPTGWRVDLRWDAPSGEPTFVGIEEAGLQRWTTAFGTVSARTPLLDLTPAGVTFVVKADGL